MIDITGLREDKRPQSSTIVHALLDRLEAAEQDVALKEKVIDVLGSELNSVANERDALRAAVRHEADCVEAGKTKIEALRAKVIHIKEVEFPRKAQAVAEGWRGKCERLEAKIAEMEKTWLSPEGYHILMQEREDMLFQAEKMKQHTPCKDISMWPTHHTQPTQPAPSVPEDGLPDQDSARPAEEQGLFRKFVVRRVDGSDAPGGKHYGCRYFVLDVDHDKHALAALTAYAADCEKTHPELAKDLREKWGAQPVPSVPEGWLRAIDEALIVAHIGIANAHDTYEQAKAKLDNLIGFHADVATDPAVNGGWKLVPIVSTHEMDYAGSEHCDGYLSTAQVVWDAMLAAAPSQEKDNGSI